MGMTQNPDLQPSFDAIDALLTAARSTTTQAQAQVTQLTAANQGLQDQVAALQAQLKSLMFTPTLGLGTNNWAASTAAVGPVPVLRSYQTAGQIPVNFAASHAGKTVGPTQHIISLKPNLDNSQDAAVTAFCGTLPDNTYLVFQHEPENVSKNITPAQFAATWIHNAQLARLAQPHIKVGAIFMAYTSDTRTPGQNAWLSALVGQSQKPDFIGWDGYSHTPNYPSAQSIFGPCVTLANGLFPKIEQIIGEWGADGTGAARAAWITTSYKWFTQAGLTIVSYFDETGTTGVYTLEGDTAACDAFKALSK